MQIGRGRWEQFCFLQREKVLLWASAGPEYVTGHYTRSSLLSHGLWCARKLGAKTSPSFVPGIPLQLSPHEMGHPRTQASSAASRVD